MVVARILAASRPRARLRAAIPPVQPASSGIICASAEQYALREEHFARVMPDDDAVLSSDTPPGEFREVGDPGVFASD